MLVFFSLISLLALLGSAQIPVPTTNEGIILGTPGAPFLLEMFLDPLDASSAALGLQLKQVIDSNNLLTSQNIEMRLHSMSFPNNFGTWYVSKALRIVQELKGYSAAYSVLMNIFQNQNQWVFGQSITPWQYIANLSSLVQSSASIDNSTFYKNFQNINLESLTRYSWKYAVSRGVQTIPGLAGNSAIVPGVQNWTAANITSFLEQYNVL